MESQQRKNRIVFIIILVVVSICVGIGYTTAYFTVKMIYDNNPEDNVTIMANVGVTFEDGDTLSLYNTMPGDSVSKTFTVTNNSDSTALYSINFTNITNTFINNEIVYSLYEVNGDTKTEIVSDAILPITTSNIINITNCSSIDGKSSKTYEFVLLFKEIDTDQSYNMEKEVSISLDITGLEGTNCSINIVDILSNPYDAYDYQTTSLAGTIVDETEDKNVRYIGENPNNYIWFNCYDYSDTSTCERWRIIGLMNNVSTAENGTQNLVKIIRADGITDTSDDLAIYWDYTTTGEYYNLWDNTELKDYKNKTRTEGGATIRRILNDAYYGTETVTTYDSKTYTYSKYSSDATIPRGITTQTLNKIEKVNWNVTPTDIWHTVGEIYATTGTIWKGYIGLMDPSDYGFATDGGTTTRNGCLNKKMNISDSQCRTNSWIIYYNPTDSEPRGEISPYQWTIRSVSTEGYEDGAIYVQGNYGLWQLLVTSSFSVRPTLYLSSYVSILGDDNSDGSYAYPYRVIKI